MRIIEEAKVWFSAHLRQKRERERKRVAASGRCSGQRGFSAQPFYLLFLSVDLIAFFFVYPTLILEALLFLIAVVLFRGGRQSERKCLQKAPVE